MKPVTIALILGLLFVTPHAGGEETKSVTLSVKVRILRVQDLGGILLTPRQWHVPAKEDFAKLLSTLEAKPGAETEGLRTYLAAMFQFQNPASFEHLLDGLRKAGMPE